MPRILRDSLRTFISSLLWPPAAREPANGITLSAIGTDQSESASATPAAFSAAVTSPESSPSCLWPPTAASSSARRSMPAAPAPETAWYEETTSSLRVHFRCRAPMAAIMVRVVQFGLEMMPSGRFFACSGFTSGTTNGTSGFIRNAPELSMATAPRSAAIGAQISETSSGTSNIAMSMPSKASGARATTVSSSPCTVIFLPAERGDAISRISPQMFSRLLMMSIMTVPTAPVAPTSARFGFRLIYRPVPA